MSEQANEQPGHVLQGPHTEIHRDRPTGFVPLRIFVQPDNIGVEITRPNAIVGRHSQADVRVSAPEASRRHCRLFFDQQRWRVVDLNSLNGVYVNGERIHEAVLYDGDRVRIAGATLTIERGSPVRLKGRKTDPEMEVLQSIADVLPRAS